MRNQFAVCVCLGWFFLCHSFCWALPESTPPQKRSVREVSKAERLPTTTLPVLRAVPPQRFEPDEQRKLDWLLARIRKRDGEWRRSRLWWSFESGRVWLLYFPSESNPPSQIPLEFLGFSFGGRIGWAWDWLILTADFFMALGEEELAPQHPSAGGSLTQVGMTLGIPLRKFLLVELGVSLLWFQLLKQGARAESMVFPLQAGVTFRIPLRTISMGLRIISVMTFDLMGNGFWMGGFAHLVLSIL